MLHARLEVLEVPLEYVVADSIDYVIYDIIDYVTMRYFIIMPHYLDLPNSGSH